MATTYNDTQIAVVDSSGNISVIYPRTKASLVSLSATSYNDVESCLAALGTAAFKNTSNTYNATGTTVATTKAVYDAYTTLNNKLPTTYETITIVSKHSSITNNVAFNKIGRFLVFSGYFNVTATIAKDNTLFTISNTLRVISPQYLAAVADSNAYTRPLCLTNGSSNDKLRITNSTSLSTGYYYISGVGILT